MSGLLLFRETPQPLPQHTHVILKLNGTEPEIRYWNARRFGRIHLYGRFEADCFLNARYGPDPLSIPFETFANILRGRKGRLKTLLMHQQVIAGIGNIYANEILFDARLHPRRRVDQLRPHEQRRLFASINTVLRGAIAEGGSSIQNFKNSRWESGNISKAPSGVSQRRGCVSIRMREHHSSFRRGAEFVCVREVSASSSARVGKCSEGVTDC